MVNTRSRMGDYEAWMVVENEEIEHYGIEVNEETKIATCWIASTAGKVVSIRIIISMLNCLSALGFG